jgi:hypothetical protein
MNVGNECNVADLTFYCIHPLDALRASDGFNNQLLICRGADKQHFAIYDVCLDPALQRS